MIDPDRDRLVVSGIGVTSAIGQGKANFFAALMEAKHAFAIMQRPGRQQNTTFLGAEIGALSYPPSIPQRLLRTASYSSQVALLTLHEAWEDAKLINVDPVRVGLIVGGSNFQQRELVQTYDKYQGRLEFLRPTYSLSFMDSDLCGICTEQFGIRGLAYTLGGASASGQMAAIQAMLAVKNDQVDVCIALGALMDLSYWECQALRSFGAMGNDRYGKDPALACRPFDKQRDGFIYGESCGAVVVERLASAESRKLKPYALLEGYSVYMDANRNPNPSYASEKFVIEQAMRAAEMSPRDIDYVNPHGTGSVIGDETELNAIRDSQLSHAFINTTKSITGHGLSAAGTVEIIASLLQLESSSLHLSRNLDEPIDFSMNWVMNTPKHYRIKNALNISIGFGGINTAICLKKYN